jgi:hypothetical protein
MQRNKARVKGGEKHEMDFDRIEVRKETHSKFKVEVLFSSKRDISG